MLHSLLTVKWSEPESAPDYQESGIKQSSCRYGLEVKPGVHTIRVVADSPYPIWLSFPRRIMV